jgi:hypothetical protein
MARQGSSSHQPGGYDARRVARLAPLRAAITQVPLPLLRSRKLQGILNALEMQIEDGGDSPEVNRLLLDALRAGVRHQLDETAARPVLDAIERFQQDEARRAVHGSR